MENYFTSVLAQTWSHLEVIIVNDGSTDRSGEIIESYRGRMQEKGIRFVYIDRKENGGQVKALNDGLKKVTGEFLTWPDIDDRMHEDYIEKKVHFFIDHPETELLITPSDIYNLSDPQKPLERAWKKCPEEREALISAFIKGRDVGYMPGSFMLRMTAFERFYPEREIFCGVRSGQATPMVFPFLFSGTVSFLNCPLYDYYLHPGNQHITQSKSQYKVVVEQYMAVIECLQVSNERKKELIRMVTNHSRQLLLGLAFREQDIPEFERIKAQLKNEDGYRMKDRIKELILKSGLLSRLYFGK